MMAAHLHNSPVLVDRTGAKMEDMAPRTVDNKEVALKELIAALNGSARAHAGAARDWAG